MILEAIVTTLNSDGSLNIAPMGPVVEADLGSFDLKPFDTSTTCANLLRNGCGVMHVSDDVLLFAKAATNQLDVSSVETVPAEVIDGAVIANACRWYEFQTRFVDESSSRVTFKCETVKSGRRRDFWGFNRGKHAVIEAAILATRVSFLPSTEIFQQYERLETIVKKTGGPAEQEAFHLLKAFVETSSNV